MSLGVCAPRTRVVWSRAPGSASTVLVMVSASDRAWPADAALRLRAEGGAWPGLEPGRGVLEPRALRLRIEGRGVPSGVQTVGDALALTG